MHVYPLSSAFIKWGRGGGCAYHEHLGFISNACRSRSVMGPRPEGLTRLLYNTRNNKHHMSRRHHNPSPTSTSSNAWLIPGTFWVLYSKCNSLIMRLRSTREPLFAGNLTQLMRCCRDISATSACVTDACSVWRTPCIMNVSSLLLGQHELVAMRLQHHVLCRVRQGMAWCLPRAGGGRCAPHDNTAWTTNRCFPNERYGHISSKRRARGNSTIVQ